MNNQNLVYVVIGNFVGYGKKIIAIYSSRCAAESRRKIENRLIPDFAFIETWDILG